MNLITAIQAVAETTAAEPTPEEKLNRFGSFISDLLDTVIAYIPTFLVALGILLVGWLFTKLVLKLMKKGIGKGRVEATVANFMFSVVKIALYIILFSIVLTILGVPAASLVAVIGTAGVAIGLALQGSLSNVAGGFIILLEKPFKIGDYIETDGENGTVKRISILYTVIETFDNRMVFIPNSTVSGKKLLNMSYEKTRRVDAKFSISYNSEYEKTKKVLLETFMKEKNILDNPAPKVFISDHASSGIEITVQVWANLDKYWDVYCALHEIVLKAFTDAGIEIPYNQLDVHIKNEAK